eukprot:16428401-Heterocapsa_arctica.AAC.1
MQFFALRMVPRTGGRDARHGLSGPARWAPAAATSEIEIENRHRNRTYKFWYRAIVETSRQR